MKKIIAIIILASSLSGLAASSIERTADNGNVTIAITYTGGKDNIDAVMLGAAEQLYRQQNYNMSGFDTLTIAQKLALVKKHILKEIIGLSKFNTELKEDKKAKAATKVITDQLGF